jgi:hypothetical protein
VLLRTRFQRKAQLRGGVVNCCLHRFVGIDVDIGRENGEGELIVY